MEAVLINWVLPGLVGGLCLVLATFIGFQTARHMYEEDSHEDLP